MNRKEHLLARVAEECNETAQRALKALAFGINEIQPGQTLNNAERLIYEFNDLVAVMQMLRADGHISNLVRSDLIQAKKDKLEKYLLYCKEVGTLTDENKCDCKVETIDPPY